MEGAMVWLSMTRSMWHLKDDEVQEDNMHDVYDWLIGIWLNPRWGLYIDWLEYMLIKKNMFNIEGVDF